MKKLSIALLLVFATFSLSAQKITKYNLSVGDKFEFLSVADQNIKQTVMNQEQESAQIVTAKEEIEVLANENGVYTMKSTNLMQAFEMGGMMAQKMHSDSAGITNLPFRIMKGSSYTFTMTETGKVTAVMGLEEVRNSMKEKLAGTMYAANADQIVGVYDETNIINQLNVTYHIYPEGGEKEWQNEFASVVNNIPISFTTTLYWEDEDTIFGTSDMKVDGDVSIQGMSVGMALGGDQKAIIDIDAATGMPSKIQTIQEMSGDMSAQGMTIPMSLLTEATTTITKK